jgi:SAM-dependent methyltransferase
VTTPLGTGIGPSEQKPVDWDRTFITGRAYGNDQKLSTRQSIYAFAKRSSEPGFFGWGLSRIAWSGTELVVDVGCGNGMWLKRLANAMPGVRTVGLDLSEGMLQSLVARWEGGGVAPVAVADAQVLPLRDHSVDVVLMMQMLYHVPDRSSALAEVRRVLRADGGAALVSTPGPRHLGELRELLRRALTQLRGREVEGPFLKNPFDSRTAQAELPMSFSQVESYVRPGLLEIPDAEPVVAHLDSQQGPDLDALVPPSATWGDVLDVARAEATAVIQAEEVFRVTTEIAGFVCRP